MAARVDGHPLRQLPDVAIVATTTPAVTAGVEVSSQQEGSPGLHFHVAVRTSESSFAQSYIEVTFGKPLGEALTPLDDDDGIVEFSIEVK